MTRNRSLLAIGFLWACCAALVAPAAARHFKVVKGTLTQVAAGRNEVFGVGAYATKTFTQVEGSLAQIAVGGEVAPDIRHP